MAQIIIIKFKIIITVNCLSLVILGNSVHSSFIKITSNRHEDVNLITPNSKYKLNSIAFGILTPLPYMWSSGSGTTKCLSAKMKYMQLPDHSNMTNGNILCICFVYNLNFIFVESSWVQSFKNILNWISDIQCSDIDYLTGIPSSSHAFPQLASVASTFTFRDCPTFLWRVNLSLKQIKFKIYFRDLVIFW